MTVYAYLRVSTDTQDTENQRIGVNNKARALGLTIDKYIIDDGVSGTKEPEKRALGGILRKLKAGDIIICSEISRLGRKLFMIMEILQKCMNCGAKLYTVKDNYELGDNIQSKCLAFAFGLSAEIERDFFAVKRYGTCYVIRCRLSNKHIVNRLFCGGVFRRTKFVITR